MAIDKQMFVWGSPRVWARVYVYLCGVPKNVGTCMCVFVCLYLCQCTHTQAHFHVSSSCMQVHQKSCQRGVFFLLRGTSDKNNQTDGSAAQADEGQEQKDEPVQCLSRHRPAHRFPLLVEGQRRYRTQP